MLSAAEQLEAELGTKPTKTTGKRQASTSDDVFKLANGVDTIALLDRLGIEHDGDKFAVCPGCGEDGALIGKTGGVSCRHDRCKHSGPPNKPGFRTPVDLVMLRDSLEPVDAARRICKMFGIDVPEDESAEAEPPTDDPPESGPRKSKPEIRLGYGLRRTVDAAVEALAVHEVYQRHGVLVDVVREADLKSDGVIRPEGTPRIRLLPRAHLHELLDDAADWRRRKKSDDGYKWVPAAVPSEVVSAVDARGEWKHIRPIEGIVQWPLLRPDGSIASRKGYDAETRHIISRAVELQTPDQPTHDDARRAVALLLDLVSDFPFAEDMHRSAWLCNLLSLPARPAIDGPVPLGLYDATVMASGKTLLASLVSWIVTGGDIARRTIPAEKAEWDKTMLGMCIAADPIVLLDNVKSTINSDALDAVLTGTTFRGRVLGKNEELVLPARTIFMVTANNAMLSEDLVRRSVHIRLEPKEERPELRGGWKIPDLVAHVREHRAELLSAVMTILRAYVVAGRPPVKLTPMGSYEAWSTVVRSAVVWAGQADPAATQEGLRESASSENEAARSLIAAWHLAYGERAVTASDVIGDVDDPDRAGDEYTRDLRAAIIAACDSKGGKLPSAGGLGYRLRKLRGRVVGGLTLHRDGKNRCGVALWSVKGAGDAGDAGDDPKRTHTL